MSKLRFLPLLVVLAMVLGAAPALAHVTSTTGPLTIKVGWDIEPSETDVLNHVTMQVWNTETGEAVTGLTSDTLNLTVTYGGQSKALDYEESDEAPGNYSAPLEPTQAGLYVVHVAGTINGTPVSQDFHIEDVKDVADSQFPAKADSTAQMQQDIAQLKSDVAALKAKLNTQATSTTTVVTQSPTPSTANKVATVGVGAVVGALAAVAVVLATRRRG